MTVLKFLILLSIFLVHSNGQFYGDSMSKLKTALNNIQNVHELMDSSREIVKKAPYIKDPVGYVLDPDIQEELKLPSVWQFACEILQKWEPMKMPLFPLANVSISERCAVSVKDFVCAFSQQMTNSSAGDTAWTMRALDSAGKFPAGMLEGMGYGNVMAGDFKECKDIKVEIPSDKYPYNVTDKYNVERKWNGEYCSAAVGLKKDGACVSPVNTTYFHIAFCAPDTCNATELSILFYTVLPVFKQACNSYVICQEEPETTWVTWFMLALVCVFFVLLVVGTLFDIFVHERGVERFVIDQKPDYNKGFVVVVTENDRKKYAAQTGFCTKVTMAFSVYTNGRKLLSAGEGQMGCIHGIRFLSMCWVVLGHTYFFSMGHLSNISIVLKLPESFMFQLINNATPVIDTFFLLSGFLLCYLFLKRAQDTNGKQLSKPWFWIMYYVHRYLRLTPIYFIILGGGYGFWNYLGTGPGYAPAKVGLFNFCTDYWWRNLLYINNMWEYGHQCIGWVWYLAVDMQLYWVSPPLLVLMYYLPIGGVVVSLVLILASAIARGVVILVKDFPPMAILTDDPKQWADPDYQNDLYGKPWMRAGPYFVGFILGYVMLKFKGRIRMPKFVAFILWVLIFGVTFAVVFGLYDFANGKSVPKGWTFLYGAFARTGWSIAVAGTIFLCLEGYGGFINSALSWSVFYPLSRLTYCGYLIHEMVLEYFYETMEGPFYGYHYKIINFFFGSLFVTYILAAVLSLAFEAPIMQLEKLIFDPSQWRAKSVPHERWVSPQASVVPTAPHSDSALSSGQNSTEAENEPIMKF